MSWSGGVYTRGYASWTADASGSLPISATKFDTEDNDFAAGLNNCLTIDGLNKPNATLNWTQIINLSRATDGNMASWGRTGGSNNPTLTLSLTDASGVTLGMAGGNLIYSGTWGGTPTFAGATVFQATVTKTAQPAFNAERITSNINLPTVTVTDLVFNSTNFQQGGTNYAVGTGIFTAPTAGIYRFDSILAIQNNAAGTAAINGIYFSKNNNTTGAGLTYQFNTSGVASGGGTINPSGNALYMTGTAMIQLAINDTVRVKADIGTVNGAGNLNCLTTSKFEGYLLG